jgi:mRNA interferase MazF
MRRGDIFYARLNPTEDSEQAGTRPVVIVSRDAINQSSPVIVVCPFADAAHITKLYPNDVLVKSPEGGLRKNSVVLAGQVRAISKDSLNKFTGSLAPQTLKQVDRALKITLDLL